MVLPIRSAYVPAAQVKQVVEPLLLLYEPRVQPIHAWLEPCPMSGCDVPALQANWVELSLPNGQ